MYREEARLDFERLWDYCSKLELHRRALEKEVGEREKRENRISLGEIIGCGVDILMSPIFYFIDSFAPGFSQ